MSEEAVMQYQVELNGRRLNIYTLPDKTQLFGDNIEELDWRDCECPYPSACPFEPSDYVYAYLKERFINLKWAPSTAKLERHKEHYSFQFIGDRK